MKHLLSLERLDVGRTLALTVGSPSVHHRGTVLKHIAFMLLFLVVGVGQVWGEDVTISNEDNSGTCVWTDGTATITQVKWAGTTAVSSNYATNLRVYGGHVLLFDAGEGNTWKSFQYTVATNYYGKTVKWGSSSSEITSSNYNSATAGTGSLVSTSGGSSTLNFTSNRYAYIYNSATSSPTQLRITSFTATYETSGGGTNNPTLFMDHRERPSNSLIYNSVITFR